MISHLPIIFTCMLICITLSFFTSTKIMAYEEPKYTILEKDGNFELRQYEPKVLAEVLLEGEADKVDNEAFFILADYINGKNKKKESISMTAPVTQELQSEKIPMTVPVEQENIQGKWRISFYMPSSYTRETLPEPLDPRIKLRLEEEETIASLRYSGSWSRDKYQKKKAELIELIGERDLTITGEPIFARYNSPFMPWFLRRNEVLIPVKRN